MRASCALLGTFFTTSCSFEGSFYACIVRALGNLLYCVLQIYAAYFFKEKKTMKHSDPMIYIRIAGVLWVLAAACALVYRSGILGAPEPLALAGTIVFAVSGLALAAVFIVKCRKGTAFSGVGQAVGDAFRKMQEEVYGNEDDGKEEISLVSEKTGKFIYRRKPAWYECTNAKWCGERVFVSFRAGEKTAPEEMLGKVEKFFDDQKKHDERIRAGIKKEFGKTSASGAVPALLSVEADGAFKMHYRFVSADDAVSMTVAATFTAVGTLDGGVKGVVLSK